MKRFPFLLAVLVAFCLPVAAQQVSVAGIVTDTDGEPLPGVSIIIKGTTTGVTTDIDGQYRLPAVSKGATLEFSYVGFTSQSIVVGSQARINVKLVDNTQTIEEVVVVGYGVQKKQSIVGSIVQQSNEELIRAGHVTDMAQALTGQLPGIITLTASGEPGGTGRGDSPTNIYIRGRNTLNGGQPLILVDGVERNMNNIDPNEVESVSVLKDASATAVFGVKGANGVILITTKRGTEGSAKLSFTYDGTAKSLSKVPDKLNSYETLIRKNEIIEREMGLSAGSWADILPMEIVEKYKRPQSDINAILYPDVDWRKAMFDDYAMTHHVNMAIQGGSSFLNYFGSLAYLHEGDMFRSYDNHKTYDPNYDFDRFNFRTNFDIRITSTTKAKINLSGYYSSKNTNYNNEGSTGSADWWQWNALYGYPPNAFIPQYEDGSWGYSSKVSTTMQNPVAVLYNLGIRTNRRVELNSDFTLEQNLDFITKGLSAKGSLFYDNRIVSQGGIFDNNNATRPEAGSNVPFREVVPDKWFPGATLDDYTIFLPSFGSRDYDWVYRPWSIRQEDINAAQWSSTMPILRRIMYQLQLNYNRQFGKHTVAGTGVFKREQYAEGNEFLHYREDWIFRGTYDFDSKYFLEANGAYNGSEKFGPGYRFDFFPSLAAGWYVSNEKFWKISWFDRLKARYSIGLVGDDNVGGRWLYSSMFASSGNRARLDPNNGPQSVGDSPYPRYRESVVGNPDIHWEKALKSNYGLEMGFLKSTLSINADYFTEKRTDILLGGSSRSIPPFFGISPPSANLAEVHSSGYELDLKYNGRLPFGLTYWGALAYTHTQNKIIKRDDPALLDPHQKNEGFAIGQVKSQIADRIYKTWDEIYASVPLESNDGQKLPGYYNIIDFNGDGIISSYDNAPVGYAEIPQNTYTFSLGAEYRGFAIMAQLYGSFNASRSVVLNNFRSQMDVLFRDYVGDYWSKDNPDSPNPLWRYKTSANVYGDRWVFDASILRLQTAELSYTFTDRNSKWLKSANVSSLKLYLNGRNLFFWSDLPDDREGTFSGGSTGDGTYPAVKRITFGLNLSF
jgi:TonB-linked SusC/RagA family outer membrane protein